MGGGEGGAFQKGLGEAGTFFNRAEVGQVFQMGGGKHGRFRRAEVWEWKRA